jgi:predicted DsbA family dithiol-disulfide isomerase
MKPFTAFIFTIIFSLSVFAQTPTETLATANGRSFTAQDLSPDVAALWVELPETLKKARKTLLENQIEDLLLRIEAEKQNLSVDELLAKEVAAKVPDPDEAEIKKIYDQNRSQLGTATLEEIRPQIVAYLRREPETKAFESYIASLKQKAKIVPGKDVNAGKLAPGDILAAVEGRNILYGEYFRENGLTLYEYEANVFDRMKDNLEQVVDAAVYASEAMSLGISTSDFIAREVTNKLKDYSDEETALVEADLRKKLYPKYRVRFFLNEPAPFIQNISTDDDPSLGSENAPVTVVMFTDLQCPACSKFYPLMKRVLAAYGEKTRLVVRDYPLAIHENAFAAAVAANAANAQGKFFEYKELLYKNQETLDTESLIKYAKVVGLDAEEFEKDLKNEKFAEEVRKDMAEGKSYGVSGTPAVFVNGYKLRTLSEQSFREAIERALKQ